MKPLYLLIHSRRGAANIPRTQLQVGSASRNFDAGGSSTLQQCGFWAVKNCKRKGLGADLPDEGGCFGEWKLPQLGGSKSSWALAGWAASVCGTDLFFRRLRMNGRRRRR